VERKVTKVEFQIPAQPAAKRVAAYARVSSGKDAMLHSLSAQVSYYSDFIQQHPGWLYCGVYADEALTGTKDDREGFQRLLAECRAGNVDMVITKSISRFARNTVTLLETVRELKNLGVDVFFEEQHIHTVSAEGELMMTILASYAQEESLSASENQKWRIQRNFEEGKPWNCTMLGYRQKDGWPAVVPEEAEIVRGIYHDYLSGLGVQGIAKKLNENGVPSRMGKNWSRHCINGILRNPTYTGCLLLQRKYRENHLTKRTLDNKGELPMYSVENSHEPIIDREMFDAVQAEIERRAKKHAPKSKKQDVYSFTGLITCGLCGKNYRRKVTATSPVWICSTYNTLGKSSCPSKQIPEETLLSETAAALGLPAFDDDIFSERIERIEVPEPNHLLYVFKDGNTVRRAWQDRSRAESWTLEMKETARRRASRQRRASK